MQNIFITGGTGYLGKRLIEILLKEGYAVKALVRNGSEKKLPLGCDYVIADAFDAATFANEIPLNATFIQLLGVAHPGPTKKKLFRSIDLASAKASVIAATQARIQHFVYVSVVQSPTRIMQDYQQCRAEAEAAIIDTILPATFLRPWYVVGPGHYWPLLLQPFFTILEWIPATKQKAKALRLLYLNQMLKALLYAVQHPSKAGVQIMEVEDIRRF